MLWNIAPGLPFCRPAKQTWSCRWSFHMIPTAGRAIRNDQAAGRLDYADG